MYKCICCGHDAPELYLEYSCNVLRLQDCEHCHDLVDKYIEYDPVIVLVDLFLQNLQAYSHILFNTPFKAYWKLFLIFLTCDSYVHWCGQKRIWSKGHLGFHNQRDFIELEIEFYVATLCCFLGTLLFNLVVFLPILIKPETRTNMTLRNDLWRGMCLAAFGKFFLVLGLIWGESINGNHIWLINLFIFVSNIQAYRVVCQCSMRHAFLIILCAWMAEKSFVALVSWSIWK